MKMKIMVLAIAVAFTASAFCLSSCADEVSMLSTDQSQSAIETDEGAVSADDDEIAGEEQSGESPSDTDLQSEDSAEGSGDGSQAADTEEEGDDSQAADTEEDGIDSQAVDTGEDSVEQVESEGWSEEEAASVDETVRADGEFVSEEEESEDTDEEGEETETEAGCTHTLVYVEYAEPTCSSEGNEEYWYCSVCGGYFLDDAAEEAAEWEQLVIAVVAENHIWETIVLHEASCAYGEVVVKCAECGNSYYDYPEPTGEHVYGEWVVVTVVTCESAGTRERRCENCGYVQTEEIGQLGHEYVAITEKEPTCTEAGVTRFACVNCGYIGDYEYPEALGHDYVTHEAKDATCTENGWEEYQTCSRCEYTSAYIAIEATGHSYADTIVEPTADAQGYTEHICQICGHSYKDSYTEYTEELTYTLIYEPTSDGDGYIVMGLEDGSECTELVIPDTYGGLPVIEIAGSAFYGNTELISVTIGANVTTIGTYAFYGCTNITEIYYNAVSASVAGIGTFRNAGRDSDGITLYVGAAVTKIPAYLFTVSEYTTSAANIIEIVFAENSSLESIGAYAFAGCNNLTSVIIPSSCTSVGSMAFYNCTSLSYAKVPEAAEVNKDKVFVNVASGFNFVEY